MTALIEAQDLVKHFGEIHAVEGISLAVAKGEVLGFLGPNGAGKSTTMKMLTGFLAPTSGSAAICGFDVGTSPIAAKIRMGYLPEGAPAYGDMTGEAFLNFVAEIRGLSGSDRDDAVTRAVETLSLGNVRHQPIETLSKGYRRRVGLAQAILHDPEVLILDEPTDGLDPNQKHEVRTLIEGMASEKAIIISTHILEEVDAVCSRAVVIDTGKIVADGTPEELRARSRYHNAVTVTIAAEDTLAAGNALRGVDGIAGIEEARINGRSTLTVLSSEGQPLLGAVKERLDAGEVGIEEITVEAGRLDDVFRSITSGETEA